MITISKIITEEVAQLPIDSSQNFNKSNEKDPKIEQGPIRLRGKKKKKK